MIIEHFALNVTDPTAASAWYVQHLGLCVLRSLTQSPYTHFLADDSGRVVVEFYRQTVAPVPDYWAMNPFVFHIAFLADDLPGAHARLIAAGAAPAGDVTVAANGDRLIFLRDPWGVPLQLVNRVVPLSAGV